MQVGPAEVLEVFVVLVNKVECDDDVERLLEWLLDREVELEVERCVEEVWDVVRPELDDDRVEPDDR